MIWKGNQIKTQTDAAAKEREKMNDQHIYDRLVLFIVHHRSVCIECLASQLLAYVKYKTFFVTANNRIEKRDEANLNFPRIAACYVLRSTASSVNIPATKQMKSTYGVENFVCLVFQVLVLQFGCCSSFFGKLEIWLMKHQTFDGGREN